VSWAGTALRTRLWTRPILLACPSQGPALGTTEAMPQWCEMNAVLESPSEVACRLNVSERTVYRWIERHGLRVTVTAGALRIERSDLDVFLASARPRKNRNAVDASDVVEHLFRAAAKIIARDGPRALTLEKLAASAGVTVGAVSYHFASRDLLVEALFERFIESFERAWNKAQAAGASPAEAYVTLTRTPERDTLRLQAILMLTASVPALSNRARRRVSSWYRVLAADGNAALFRCLSADALWLFEVIGLSPLSAKQQGALFE
jgi:excisionase family DNA binding protein